MPLVRKLITVGNSKAVIIPRDWLKYHEEQMGQPVEVMLMEVNNIITLAVKPVQDNEGAKDKESTKGVSKK